MILKIAYRVDLDDSDTDADDESKKSLSLSRDFRKKRILARLALPLPVFNI
jgi:hypothetical protein